MTATERRPRVIVNRFAGKCAECGAAVNEGHGFIHKAEDDKWVTECYDCAAVGRDTLPLGKTASRGGSSVAVHRCLRCNGEVAWSQNKAGKWYLANVVSKPGGARQVGFVPHTDRCNELQARDAAVIAKQEAEAAEREQFIKDAPVVARRLREWAEATIKTDRAEVEERLRLLESVNRRDSAQYGEAEIALREVLAAN